MKIKGKKVLITAGPTYEKIDPVRFIGNRSSGKMGCAIASVLAELGAKVHLIIGPSKISLKNNPNIDQTNVETAQEMYEASCKIFDQVDIAIFSAAVADYRPKNVVDHKIKKKDASFTIELEPTIDILSTLGNKKTHQKVIGFALETDNELTHAKEKLKKKNADLIVLNSLNDKNAGFSFDTNKVTLITHNKVKEYALKSKSEVACDIIDFIEQEL